MAADFQELFRVCLNTKITVTTAAAGLPPIRAGTHFGPSRSSLKASLVNASPGERNAFRSAIVLSGCTVNETITSCRTAGAMPSGYLIFLVTHSRYSIQPPEGEGADLLPQGDEAAGGTNHWPDRH